MPRRKEKSRSSFAKTPETQDNVFEKVLLDVKAEGLNVDLREYGLAPFRKEQ